VPGSIHSDHDRFEHCDRFSSRQAAPVADGVRPRWSKSGPALIFTPIEPNPRTSVTVSPQAHSK
jgi:hypothetical protein